LNFTKLLMPALALAASLTVHAQGAASAPPASSPAKKALVQKLLSLQQPAVEGLAVSLAEQPAMQLMQQAGMALQQMPGDKREAIAKDIQADARKYADETVPLMKDKAAKIGPGVLGPLLEERFNEDELKQVIAWMESPVSKKYQQLAPEMQRALSEKLVAETRTSIEPKLQALQDSMAKRLGVSAPPAPAAPAKPASAPKKK
jgi:hypothetical protein